jgi:hypothetical protein
MSGSDIDDSNLPCLQSFKRYHVLANVIELNFAVCSNRQANASSMESQSEELSRLRAENACMKQLLTSNDAQMASTAASYAALLACKDELLASRAIELQRCKEDFLQHKAATAELHAAVADSSKTQRLYNSSSAETPLDRDVVLDDVFSFVGGGDHLHIGGVSRRWRGRYVQYCAQTSASELDGKFVTRQRSVLVTGSRFKLALSSGLRVARWNLDTQQHAYQICSHSLEPEEVITLLRLHGVPWSTELCNSAAYCNKLALLQWLRAHSCPWREEHVTSEASAGGNVGVLEWLLTVTAPWSSDSKQKMLFHAGCDDDHDLALPRWLRAHDAVWPKAFCTLSVYHKCWHVSAVQWALSCSSGWLDWTCEDYAADKYRHAHFKKQAAELLEWAHANGCPCTCGHTQQQQQQQQQQ